MSVELPPLPPMPYVMEKPAVRQYAIDYARAALAARKPLTRSEIMSLVVEYNPQNQSESVGFTDGILAAEKAHGIGEKQ